MNNFSGMIFRFFNKFFKKSQIIVKPKSLLNFGFTLLELLVVIAIIGLLASIVVMATRDARLKAQHNQVLQQLNQIELAFILYASDNFTQWPNTFRQHNPAMSDIGHCYFIRYIIRDFQAGECTSSGFRTQVRNDFPNFSNYLSSVPVPPEYIGFYAYLNPEKPVGATCPDAFDAGVSIRIGTDTPDPTPLHLLRDYLDEKIDDGDGFLCGRIRYDVTWDNLFYRIADDTGDINY